MMWAWRCRCLSLSYCILRAVMSVLILSMYTQSLLPGPSSDSAPYAPGPTTEMSIPGKTSSQVHFKCYYSSPFFLLLNYLRPHLSIQWRASMHDVKKCPWLFSQRTQCAFTLAEFFSPTTRAPEMRKTYRLFRSVCGLDQATHCNTFSKITQGI